MARPACIASTCAAAGSAGPAVSVLSWRAPLLCAPAPHQNTNSARTARILKLRGGSMRGLVDPGPTECDPDDFEVAYNSDDSELSGQGRVGAEDRAEADEMRLREKLPGYDSEVRLFGRRAFFSCGKLL